MDAPHIGLVGLGRMGRGLGGRLKSAGIDVSGFDPSPEARASAAEDGIEVSETIEGLVERIPRPRHIWVMVPAGEATESTVDRLGVLLDRGDSIVEGGNSDYRDSMRLQERLARRGVAMLDVGTSGGILGQQAGFALMIGGRDEDIESWKQVFEVVAPRPDLGWAHVGGPGAGHYAKMVHNAIEYGIMQAYGEGVALLSAAGEPGVDVAAATRAWRHGSIISSTLMDLTAAIVADGDLEHVRPHIDDSGLGRLAVATAVERGIALPIITQSLIERIRSRDEDGLSARVLAALRGRFGGHTVHKTDTDQA